MTKQQKIVWLLIPLLICYNMMGCTSNTFHIEYDDIMLYVTPISEARPGDVVQVHVTAREGKSFLLYANDILLSMHQRDEYFITYEFIMPYRNVTVTHSIQEEPQMNPIVIPATMQTHHIDYSTPHTFNDDYHIITTKEDAEKFLAGFSFHDTEKAEIYTEDFFQKNIIVACMQHEGSGSITHSLKNVILDANHLNITIVRHVPSIGTCDMASYLCLIAISTQCLPTHYNIAISTIQENI